MKLIWVGVIESVIAGGVGLWLYTTLPAADAVWGEALWTFAGLSLLASLAFGREGQGRGEAEMTPEAPPVESPPPASSDSRPRLPEPVAATPLGPPAASLPLTALLPERVAHVQWEVIRSRWDVAARQAAWQWETLAGSESGENRRHTRRLTDAAFLRHGYQALMRGERPHFDGVVVDADWTVAEVESRLDQLAADEQVLRDQAAAWLVEMPADAADGRVGVALARQRYDMLGDAEARWEQVALLTRAYQELRERAAQRGGERSPHAEGDTTT